MKLSQNFSLREFTRSATADRLGVCNFPTDAVIENLRHLCQTVLQPLRDHLGCPVVITSGFRCPAVNRAVGGVPRSQHLVGEAADLQVPFVPGTRRPDIRMARVWMAYVAERLPFDQLILEHSGNTYWIHVSCRRDATKNRRKVFELEK